jgi:ABC-type dipeptide/oligopeptide/nickel transport system permease subunit
MCALMLRGQDQGDVARRAYASLAFTLPFVLGATIIQELTYAVRGWGVDFATAVLTRDFPVVHFYGTIAISLCIIVWLFVPRSNAERPEIAPVSANVRSPLVIAALCIIIVYVLAAAIGPYVMPYDAREISQDDRYEGPSWDHWLGTGQFGEDLLTALVEGARPPMIFAGIVALLGWLPGAVGGSISARRWPTLGSLFNGGLDWVYVLPLLVLGGLVAAAFPFGEYSERWFLALSALVAAIAGLSSGVRSGRGGDHHSWRPALIDLMPGVFGIVAVAIMLHTTLETLHWVPVEPFGPSWAFAFAEARQTSSLTQLYAVTICVLLITWAFAFLAVRLGGSTDEPRANADAEAATPGSSLPAADPAAQ